MEKAAHHGNRKEKGLTLVETIISLAIITTITLATVSIIFYSTNALRNSSVKAFFTHEANACSEIYISYRGDAPAYKKAMLQYSGYTVNLGEDHTFYYDGKFAYTSVDAHAYSMLLDFDTDQLQITVSDNKGGTVFTREVHL